VISWHLKNYRLPGAALPIVLRASGTPGLLRLLEAAPELQDNPVNLLVDVAVSVRLASPEMGPHGLAVLEVEPSAEVTEGHR
jgi:hypothetical protein